MNREIKFRAWDKNEKKFWYFDPLKGVFADAEKREDYRKTIQQFTGLKDKNGKEIYEGDILKMTHIDDEGKEYLAIIEYCGAEFIAEDVKTHGTWHFGVWGRDEIIGNIYENSELIK